jgi:hypothetical protein
MLLSVLAVVSPLAAHDPADDHAAAAAAANNPLANMTSFQLQNYYVPDLCRPQPAAFVQVTVAGGSDDKFLNGETFFTLTEAMVQPPKRKSS